MMLEIRLLDFFAVDEQPAVRESHRLARQTHDPLQQHLMLARHPDGHHIAALRVRVPISQFVYEIASTIVVSGEHAVPLHAHLPHDVLKKEEFEKHEANRSQNCRADERSFRITPDDNDLYDAKPARETGHGGSGFHSTIHKRQELPLVSPTFSIHQA